MASDIGAQGTIIIGATTNVRYRFRRNWSMSLMWATFALVCFAIAALPWVIVTSKGSSPPGLVITFSVAWSAVSAASGAYLLFWALCRTELSGGLGRVSRRDSLFCFSTTAEYSIDRAYLIRQWHYRKHGGTVPREVLFVRAGRRKYRLADELTCADLPGLLRWIAEVIRVRTFDARHRRPIDI